MNSVYAWLKNWMDQEFVDQITSMLARRIYGSILLRLSFILLTLVVGLILARVLGPSEYGVYSYAVSIAMVASVTSLMGVHKLLVREIASMLSANRWEHVRGVLFFGDALVVCLSVLLFCILGSLFWFVYGDSDPVLLEGLLIGLFLFMMIAFTRIRSGAIRGFNYTFLGQVPRKFVFPALFLTGVIISYLFLDIRLTASSALGIRLIASASAFLCGTGLLMYVMPGKLYEVGRSFESFKWLKTALPLLMVGGFDILLRKTDIIMLGAIRTSSETGLYAVASRGAGLIPFLMYALKPVLSPVISRLFANEATERLQRIITLSIWIVFVFSLPGVIAFVTFGDQILYFVFGKAYIPAHVPLAILSLSYLIQIGLGLSGALLMMTDFEQLAAWGVGIGALVNISLNAFLIPIWGIVGASAGTGTSLVVQNLIQFYWCRKHVGIFPGIFGRKLPWSQVS